MKLTKIAAFSMSLSFGGLACIFLFYAIRWTFPLSDLIYPSRLTKCRGPAVAVMIFAMAIALVFTFHFWPKRRKRPRFFS